jgi:hypothetical protein
MADANDPAAADHSSWRQQLGRLEPLGLPLLPCGAGKDGKSPLNPQTGYGLAGWETAAFSVPQILAMNGVVRSVGTRTGDGRIAFDIDGGTALELCLARGCDPQQAITWQVHRDTDPLRLKVLWLLTPQQQRQLGAMVSKKLITRPPIRDDNGRVLEKAEAVELFHHTGRQVILLGQHPTSGGHYFWPDGLGPEALAPIPEEWWALALECIGTQDQPLLDHTPASPPTGVRVPLLEFVTRATRIFVQTGGIPGRWNDDQLTHALDLIATEAWIEGQGHVPEPTARQAFADHITAARQLDRAFDSRKAWKRFDGGIARNPQPGTPEEKLRSRLAHWIGQAGYGPQPRGDAARQGSPEAPGAAQSNEDKQATFRELLSACLAAIRSGDRDAEMEVKAELKGRFRVTDEQIQTDLFRQWRLDKVERRKAQHDSIALSAVAPLRYRMDGFIQVGDIGLTYGPYGTGKTTYSLAKMYAHATGSNLLDRDTACDPGRCLFIATDSGAAALKKSLFDLGIDPDDDPILTPGHPDQRIWIWAHEPEQGHDAWICDIHGVIRLEEFIKAKGITYVVIDSAKAVSTPAGWSYCSNESVKALLQCLREVVAQPTGAFIEFLSHDGTEKGSHSGAKAWAEDPSMVCALSVAKDDDGRPSGVTCEFRKDRAAVIEPRRSITFFLAEGQLKLKPGIDVVGTCEDAILTILWEAHQNDVASVSAKSLVDEVFTRFRRSRKTVENTLARIAGTGKGPSPTPVIRPKRGHYCISPAEAQNRTSRAHASRPLSSTGGINLKPIAAQSVCNPPIDPPSGEAGGDAKPPNPPAGEAKGGAENPVSDCELVELPPDAGVLSRAHDAPSWVRFALDQCGLLPDHPEAAADVTDYLAQANPAITPAQIQEALDDLCQ